MDGSVHAAIDPIQLEIIRHGLVAIPNEIDANITRTAFSPLVYEYKDFATGVVDPEGRLVAQGSGSIPIFVANALGNAVRDGLEIYGADNMHEGDVIISNHAGTLGQHLNNVVMYTPVFAGPDRDELFGFMCVLVHWIDIGGSSVGSCSASDATEIFQEGIRIPALKLFEAGVENETLIKLIEMNVRLPDRVIGDLKAQFAACRTGARELGKLAERYGVETAAMYFDELLDYAERMTRAEISTWPDGTYSFTDYIDDDGFDKGPISIVCGI